MELVKQEKEFTQEQIALIKQQVAPNANQSELQLFLYQCKRTGLDPMVRQIYCIHRGGKMTIQTSIDGFRVIAERSNVYAGQDEPVFAYDEKGNILKCSVTVYKFSPQGVRYPAATGVAYWAEYAQTGPMWTKMKHTMISKCAEALALRKAFPQDLSGIYTADEMSQADTDDVLPKRISIKDAKIQAEEIKTAIKDLLDCESVDDLKKLKAQLPPYVLSNESFIEAGRQRFAELTAETLTSETEEVTA